MKKQKTFFILGIIVFLNTFAWAGTVYILNSNSETISKYDTESGEVINDILQVGQYANQIVSDSERAYVVNSGEHNVQVIDLANETTTGSIPLPNGSNPYWMILMPDGTKGYVTGLMTNKTYVIDTQSLEVINTIDVGLAPEGLCLWGETLFVVNTEYNWTDPYSTKSTLSVIDTENNQVITTIQLDYYNAQYCDLDAMGRLHVVCSGAYDNTGRVYIIDTQSFTVCDSVMIGGSPTKINIHDNGIAYLADAFGQGCMAYDTNSLEIIHSNTDLFAQGGTFIQFDINGNIYIGDALNWIDNGKVYVYSPEEQLTTTFTVGIIPIDAAFYGFEPEPGIGDSPQPADGVQLSNFPNPFSTSTTISFSIPPHYKDDAEIEIYNLKGQRIRELKIENLKLKINKVVWDGKDAYGKQMPSGIYFAKLSLGEESAVKKMLLLR
ncbi:MAG: T9SS type A sorting domain-containing protein [Candidatus Cloacimonadia bacterium]